MTASPSPAIEWVRKFMNEFQRLKHAGDFDLEFLHEEAQVAYAYTIAKELNPETAAQIYVFERETPWVVETLRLANDQWRNTPGEPETVQDSQAVLKWINDTTTELHRRLPGTSAVDLKSVALGLAFHDDFKGLDPTAAAAQWQTANPGGISPVPF